VGGGEGGAANGGSVSGVSGGVSVSLVRESSEQEEGLIAVSVPKEMATAGSGFNFKLPDQVTTVEAGKESTMTVTTVSGSALPAWLRFNTDTKTFVAAAVPDGAFPMTVLVKMGGKMTTVVISARTE
jgi:hypothetical protein